MIDVRHVWVRSIFAVAAVCTRRQPPPAHLSHDAGATDARPVCRLAMQSVTSSDQARDLSHGGLRIVASCDDAIQLAARDNCSSFLALLPRDVRAEVDRHLLALAWHDSGVLVPIVSLPHGGTLKDDGPEFAVTRNGKLVMALTWTPVRISRTPVTYTRNLFSHTWRRALGTDSNRWRRRKCETSAAECWPISTVTSNAS